MNRLPIYTLACAALAGAVVLGLDRFLDPAQANGLAVAGIAAVLLQCSAFAARARWGTSPNRLLATWVWSTGVRFTAILVMGFAVWKMEALDEVTGLVGLAGFLFVMLLLEPAFFSPARLELDEGEIVRG